MTINIAIEIEEKELMRLCKIEETKDEKPEDNLSPYSRIFDKTNPNWTDDPGYNRLRLICIENYVNEHLKTRGYIFLNDVYKVLGLPFSKAGQIVGWVYNDNHPRIDFGIHADRNADFINGRRNTCILDFRVDGVILNDI